METCYKAFRAGVLKTMPLRSERFGIEPEITAKIAKRGCVIFEVPISYYGRGYADGKKIGWKDGFQAIYTILKYALIDDCFDAEHSARHLKNYSTGRRAVSELARRLAPLINGAATEFNSGIGDLSRRLPKREPLTVAASGADELEILRHIFADNEMITVAPADPSDAATLANLPPATTAILTDLTAEKILAAPEILRNLRDYLLRSAAAPNAAPARGRLLLETALYSITSPQTTDAQAIRDALTENGFRITYCKRFNFAAWTLNFINTKILRRQTRGKWSLKAAEVLSFFTYPLEKILPLPGYSVIITAEPDEET
jgi:hypothetical protein